MSGSPAKKYSDLDVMLIGVELGLADLFNDNESAMGAWMRRRRPQFDGLSALELLERSEDDGEKLLRARSILGVLNRARNVD